MHEWASCHEEAANHQLPIVVALQIIQIACMEELFKLNIKFDADLLLYSFSHFECSSHTGHTLTQQRLLPPH